ncbi:Eco57I restriction-modification methylase domain-containing protein [Syntrophobacter fumaroxidans]|uniref:site-specific DNA-methyltransferase (adenine-specific) n=1 Tax=Syntrophobacter fumaroxidans (strain DSM 10017 / MPOB) TaxID=335543 RepID=A0LQ14_SYNFM|nr:type IIL restriction-modification enzyme MmeI [Syntrophobacter fumaroxidans]ABK19516.1 conserved hypothetical protein [Syntrophobacter fumaroxidans MPOB]
MKNLSKHAEWLSLIEISGPFLTVSMLDKAFPQGLEAVETPRRQKLRAAYEEWREAVDQEDKLLPELHREWVRLVLTEMLEYDHESLVHAGDWPDELPSVSSQEHAGTFKPDWIVRSPADGKPRLFIAVLPPDTDLESVQRGDGWPVSLQERMTLLCRAHGVRVGLLTDGERWMLVNAPVGSTSSQASWYARLWFQEPITLKAFQSLLGVRRCFGPAEDTLESLLDESLKHHEEVTDTLGEQVRRAVEVLVQCLDKADEDRNRELLHDVKPVELYEAGLTVMMRLVFVLCAEERGLLLLGDSVYDRCYAVSTLRGQLAEEADRHGPEVLDRRHDAWARLLAVFRVVYGGIEHESLRMPALGGSLFDPDRFPFLEGRAKGTGWRDTSAAPLPIDNRTVLLLLNSLQILEQSGGALLLSYRALDVEQIGHVYEGLLEHTVARVPRVTLGLQGSQKAKNPNVALAELESARLDGEAALVKLVLDVTGRSESAIRNGLSKPADDTVFGRVLGVCGGDTELAERIRPFTNLIRTDAWDDPIVYRDNSFMVTLGADRRETGTHYTPKSLTESIVTTTLEPVVYIGPAEGKPREEWKLKSSREILDLKVCDPAMGSGAFLVQACRYLGEKLVEAWLHEEAAGKAITVDGEALDQLGAEEPLPPQLDERLTIARRLVAERCLYGVDINPLAVELAKLSIWLVTLAKGRPFGFLDHNLRSGDSLLGIHRLEQLTRLRMDTESGRQYQLRIFGQNVEAAVNEAIELRKRLRATTIRDIKDVEAMARLDREARRKLESVELIADAMIGEALRCGGNSRALDTALDTLATMAGDFLGGNEKMGEQIVRKAKSGLAVDLPGSKSIRKPFHWNLEFPEVFGSKQGGFDVWVSNPPFMGGRKISSNLGESYEKAIKRLLMDGAKGSVNLVAYFFLRSLLLLRNTGIAGFIATDSITESDTRTQALARVFESATTYFGLSSFPWPGKAGVHVSVIVFSLRTWKGTVVLDGEQVESISTMLEPGSELQAPYPLSSNAGFCSDGVKVQGIGFVLEETEALSILATEPASNAVITKYVVGDDINKCPHQTGSRWVINFWTREKDEAEKFKTPWAIVEERVRPYREKLTRQVHESCFWKFWDRREAFHNRVRQHGKALVASKLSKHFCLTFGNPAHIYSEKVKLFDFKTYSAFAVLQSVAHTEWALVWGSTTGETPAYVGTSCFDTFPFPSSMLVGDSLSHEAIDPRLETVGKAYFEQRATMCEVRQLGFTAVYNLVHSQTENAEDVVRLRELIVQLDRAVLAAYGWQDVEPHYQFVETKRGSRFGVDGASRVEVLKRLSALNRQRYEEEVARRLLFEGAPRTSSRVPRSGRSSSAAPSLPVLDFEARSIAALNGTDSVSAIFDFLRTHEGWHTKADIIAAIHISDAKWKPTIDDLMASGRIERQGERRGARYRAVKNGGNR